MSNTRHPIRSLNHVRDACFQVFPFTHISVTYIMYQMPMPCRPYELGTLLSIVLHGFNGKASKLIKSCLISYSVRDILIRNSSRQMWNEHFFANPVHFSLVNLSCHKSWAEGQIRPKRLKVIFTSLF